MVNPPEQPALEADDDLAPLEPAEEPNPQEPEDVEASAPGAATIAVMGSCISRDIFNSVFVPDWRQHWDCVVTQTQSSMIALASAPLTLTAEQLGEASAYRERVVRMDLEKTFFERLAELRPQYLLMDFFGDVHFGYLDLGEGVLATDNRWQLWQTPFHRELRESGRAESRRWQHDPEGYFRRWAEAFDAVVGRIRQASPETRLILHRGFNTREVILSDGARMLLKEHKKLSPLNVVKANAYWRRLDDYAAGQPGIEVIDLREGDYPSFQGHPWGPFYVHYTMDYYCDLTAELNLIRVRDELADRPELGVLVDQGLAAWRSSRVEQRERQAHRREFEAALVPNPPRAQEPVEPQRAERGLAKLRRTIRGS